VRSAWVVASSGPSRDPVIVSDRPLAPWADAAAGLATLLALLIGTMLARRAVRARPSSAARDRVLVDAGGGR
jgi:hypothetical protein